MTLPTLSVVVPAYNEEARLPALLQTLEMTAPAVVRAAGFELLETVVVDDGSSDRTREILASASASQPRLKAVLDRIENRGKGASVAEGVRHAGGDFVLLVDVDLSTPLEELHKLGVAIGEGADVAVGSRAVVGAIVERGPRHRKVTGKAFGLAVRTLTGLGVRDTQNGFKLLPAAAARDLLSEQICPGFAFDVELLMRAKRAGLRIAEVPVLYVHDSRSRVQVGSASLQMLRDLTVLAYRLRQDQSSMPVAAGDASPLGRLSADDSD
jgi:dolichyl-phosphate beta-glucosyltransferase